MDSNSIKEYAGLMKELGLTGLEITDGDKKIRLEMQSVPAVETKIIKEEVQKAPEAAETPAEAAVPAGNFVEVTSPMVGVFYAAPTEDSEPFVKEGARVKKGDILCIVEAMKLMNEITAETDGTIAEVCACNQQVVEYGTVLFRIEV